MGSDQWDLEWSYFFLMIIFFLMIWYDLIWFYFVLILILFWFCFKFVLNLFWFCWMSMCNFLVEKKKQKKTKNDKIIIIIITITYKILISFESTPILLILNETNEESFLYHMIDTSGQANFYDEVVSCIYFSDGIILMVSVLESVMAHT